MEEPLAPLGRFRTFSGRQHLIELHSHERRVDHAPLCTAGVDVAPPQGDDGLCGIKILILQLADLAPVHGVGAEATEARHVETVGTTPDLLVRREGDAHRAMLHLGVCQKILHRRYDGRHARLIVGPEERCPIGDDQLLPHVII